MALSDAEKLKGAREFCKRRFLALAETAEVDTADLKAAFEAAVEFVQDNKISFNAALPQPFKGTATDAQKVELLAIAALYELGGL